VESVYMLCSLLFILALGGLSQHESSRKGNFFGIISMTLAIGSTFLLDEFNSNFVYFIPAFSLGGLIGLTLALKVEMIMMPQMVAALHSFVGIAATLVGYSKYLHENELNETMGIIEKSETFVGVFMGAITFTGSVVAFAKLQGLISGIPLLICGRGRHVLNILAMILIFGLGYLFLFAEDETLALQSLMAMTGISFFVGWHLVMAIGGADMPVVVSMLNSYSGWTTSASGFLLQNNLLIITGALVGSSGAILSYIMCRAMNRSFFSVIMGGFGQGTTMGPVNIGDGVQTPIKCSDFVAELVKAKSVVIVPGYGMAVARAQHDVGELADVLRKMGKEVHFCIHPVAGRLPGHMNVLLAEANVPYNIVMEMSEINKDFPHTDISMIIGANDIVNPDAQENPNSPIAGMPVCEVWKSKMVCVFKRGSGTGYAGIDNPLFVKPNTRMFFGSADKSVKDILGELKGKAGDNGPAVKEVKKEEVVESEPDDGVYPDPQMIIGVPKEVLQGERRVAITPKMVRKFRKSGFEVIIEKGAGEAAGFWDSEYEKYGAKINRTDRVWRKADIILKVRKPSFNPELNQNEQDLLENVKLLVCYVYPAQDLAYVDNLAKRYPKLTIAAMDCVPRITRAQKLDSLSSMANVAGYRAVVEAFNIFKKCPKAQITAAGKLPPAKVFIIGCGVAGLAAIGYCRNFGCIVKAFDTRSAAREQAESLGAEFVEVKLKEEGQGVGGYAKEMSDDFKRAQDDLTKEIARVSDIVITTALIPGKPAPKLIKEEVVRVMRPGSVIVDMAAEMGGNCELTEPGEAITDPQSGVIIIGYTDLVSRMAPQSSELFANNLWHLLDELGGASKYHINMQDEIVNNMVVANAGEVTWIPLDKRPPPPPPQAKPAAAPQAAPVFHAAEPLEDASNKSFIKEYGWLLNIALLATVFLSIGYSADVEFLGFFLIFILAIVIGYMVIWNVTPALHTPLMSVTNAISGIIVIGAMLELTPASEDVKFDEGSALGFTSLFFASINVVGGFVVTYRMLEMFRKK